METTPILTEPIEHYLFRADIDPEHLNTFLVLLPYGADVFEPSKAFGDISPLTMVIVEEKETKHITIKLIGTNFYEEELQTNKTKEEINGLLDFMEIVKPDTKGFFFTIAINYDGTIGGPFPRPDDRIAVRKYYFESPEQSEGE